MTRQINPSSSSFSLAGPSIPIHREVVRTATSVLCKEMLKPSQSASLEVHESEEVECRMRALTRLERVWGNGASTNGSTTQPASGANMVGEERRLFTEALRNGYVLCQ